MSLTSSDFSAFFHELWGQDPWPWQRRLCDRVAAEGVWPAQLDLPTGAGKTAALDIALFLLALEAELPPTQQRFPRRIFLVVDRRTIVDQAFARAEALARKLREARAGTLGEVARLLQGLHSGTEPVETALLRGGMARDEGWARHPDRPLLGLSTVDQVGSRLLFRGYGVSDGMRPVHAGLLGADCLYLLDEVHLSAAFDQTLSLLVERHGLGRRRVQICRLSATPRPGRAGFSLQPEDREHPVLRARLEARKPATLVPIEVKGDEAARIAAFSAELARLARGLAGPGRTVGVVVNRVETARRVAQALEGAEVALLTGRMRPLDRREVEQRIAPWVDPAREPGQGPARYVVATQCIEAGADYDFDGLVCECAALDALRQRVGRLNRSGRRDGARAIVAVRRDQLGADDPVYGGALAATWNWLAQVPELDFGISAFPAPPADRLADLLAPVVTAPLLLPGHLDTLVQTSPAPDPEPDISLFLHGPQREAAEVSVVWRADLEPYTAENAPQILDRLEAAPPGGLEALPLPLGAFRRWRTPGNEAPISLSDGGAEQVSEERRPRGPVPEVFRWRGEDSGFVSLDALRPGDTVVLPAAAGGLYLGTFDPEQTAPVLDRGDEVQRLLRGRPTLRVHPALLAQRGLSAPDLDPEADDFDEALDAWLEGLAFAAPFLGPRRRRVIVHDDGSLTLVSRQRSGPGEDASTEPATSSFTGVAAPLGAHLRGVGARARRYAERVGLDPARVADLECAGTWHDLGKLDPRFQRWLHNGNRVAHAMAAEPLAKSSLPAQDREARRRAREKSGYPAGARHELQSLALLEAASAVRAGVEARGGDWDLICFLVASHHGFSRPFAPVVADPEPVPVAWEGVSVSSAHGLERLDSGVSDRFWRLVERYGAHGLAWFEAILRLADHRQSQAEQEGQP